MDPVPCLAEWLIRGPCGGFVRERRMGGGAPVKLVRLQHPAGFFSNPPSGDIGIRLLLAGTPTMRLDHGDGRREARWAPGTFAVAPAGTGTRLEVDDAHAALMVALPWTRVREVVEEASGGRLRDLGPLHRSPHVDSVTRDLLHALWRASEGEGPASRLFVDGMLQALVASLVRLALPAQAPQRATALPAWRLRRAQQMLAERLDEDVALADVAASVGLSTHHFARSFKAATGVAPHAWRNSRRIAHAQALLERTGQPVAEIAAACGFCSQAHLTTAFKRVAGTTPAAWRRERLGA